MQQDYSSPLGHRQPLAMSENIHDWDARVSDGNDLIDCVRNVQQVSVMDETSNSALRQREQNIHSKYHIMACSF